MTWSTLFASTDDAGRERLTEAALGVINSLDQSLDAPRSSVAPLELHERVRSLDICPDEGVDLATVLQELGTTVWAHGVVPTDTATVAHLHPPTTLSAVVTEMAIATTNQSMDSWDQAPMATALELHLMGWLGHQLGFPATSTGVMTSGGTASNVLGITLARSHAGAALGVDILKSGLPPEAHQWRILCSDQAHFSVQRAAGQLGLGRDAVVTVPTTEAGAMDIAALDEVIRSLQHEGLTIIALVGTAGTTDLGAIDPLDQIGERARALGAWFHVDGAVAGSFIMSPALRTRLTGIAMADSVTVDFHKLWWQPFNASALVVRDETSFNLLRVKSNYLDRGDELDGMVNLVGRSLDTSRRFDAAKVVASLRTIGRSTFAAMIEHLVSLATYCGDQVSTRAAFALVSPIHGVTCVFDAPGYDAESLRLVQQQLLLRGEAILGRTEIKGRAALKCTFMNPLATCADVDRILDMIEAELPTTRR